MVGLNSFTLGEQGKQPKHLSSLLPTHPPPSDLNLDDFSYQCNEPFADFDSIDDWIIEPDSLFVPIPMEGSGEQDTQLASLQKNALESKLDGQPECSDGSDSMRTEIQFSEVKRPPNGSYSTEIGLDISEKIEVSTFSIAEEMGKVCLVPGSNPVAANSERDGLARIDNVNGDVKLNEAMTVDNRVVEKNFSVGDTAEKGETLGENGEVSKLSDTEDSSSSSTEEETDSDESEEEEEEEGDDDDDGSDDSDDDGEASSSSSSEEGTGSDEGEDNDNDDDSDDSDDDEKETKRKMDDDGEVEEGEIRDIDQVDTLATSEDEEGFVLKGRIKSKNEIEVNYSCASLISW